MKAIVLNGFGSVDHFEMATVDDPKVLEHEVLIKIQATAFNPIDYQMRQGSTESKLLKSPILGRELSGIIIQTGRKVTAFSIGDKVSAYVGSLASNGTYAELISMPQQLVAKNPETLSFAQATALPMVGMTALQCFQRLNIPKDEPVFISGGAGGVGTILIKLLLANGNRFLLSTTGNEDSKNHLINLGLDAGHIINYKQENLIEIIRSKVGHTNLKYCIDLVGDKMAEVCAELLQVHGTYADVTHLTTTKAREILFDKATTIVNIANYAYALTGNSDDVSFYGKSLAQLFNMIKNELIAPTEVRIVGNLSIETVKKAHILMEQNETRGKKLIMTNY